MNPLTALPTKVRKWIYVYYSTLGIAFGAVQVGYATADAAQPSWLLVAFGVFAYLGTALGLVAAANTAPVSRAQAEEFRRLADALDRQGAAAGAHVARAMYRRKSADE